MSVVARGNEYNRIRYTYPRCAIRIRAVIGSKNFCSYVHVPTSAFGPNVIAWVWYCAKNTYIYRKSACALSHCSGQKVHADQGNIF